MSIGFGLHADIDAGVAQWLCKRLLLRKKPDKIIILSSGKRYERAGEFDKFFHFDTGGIYDPKNGDFDHHLIPKDHPKAGKCTSLLVMDYIEECLGEQSDEYRTIAQFAQVVDKEKWRGWAEKYNLYAQDPISAPILAKLPEIVGQANRSTYVTKKDIIITINTTIEAYLQKRRESKGFRDWYFANKKEGVVVIEENTPFNVPALIVKKCPYDSGDFRGLVNHYLKIHSLIIACYHLKDAQGKNLLRYGVNKPDWLPELDLHRKYRILCEKFPGLAEDNDKLFLHNNGLFMYMNEIPPDFTFEDWVKVILKD